MKYFTDEVIRFRVVNEIFTETSPSGPKTAGEGENAQAQNISPYTLWVCNTILIIPFLYSNQS